MRRLTKIIFKCSTIIVHLRATSLENAEKLSAKLIEAASIYRKGENICSFEYISDLLKHESS
jgi:hypothetical protein